MLILAISVGVPGLVLSSFAFRSVRSEALVEQAHLQDRCESVAGLLYEETRNRFEQLERELGGVIDQAGNRWTERPGQAISLTMGQVSGVKGILILDDGGNLRHPSVRALTLATEADRPLFAEELRTVMGRPFRDAEFAEIREQDPDRAASLYQVAIPGIPGYRGQLIARNARARCLLRAGRAAEALTAYRGLAAEAEGHLDFNGFPLELLAMYQVSQCQLALGDESDAARTLRELFGTLSESTWGYGGSAESLLAERVLDQLAEPRLRGQIPPELKLDYTSARRDLERARNRQDEQAMVVALLPELVASRVESAPDPGRFVYERKTRSGEPFLFARTTWNGPGGYRGLILHLDEDRLLEGVMQRLDGIQQANPELAVALGEVGIGPTPLAAPSQGVVYQLEPWVPGRTIVVSQGDPTSVSSMLSRSRRVRLLMIGTFSLFILLGLGISYRAVRREFEIARIRTDFVSNVSHELRTPLATIRIMSEMLTMGAVPPGEKQQEYHSTILSETERLTRLIDNVLDFARIEQGRKKYRFVEGDLMTVVEEVQRVTQDYLASAKFELAVEAQPELPSVRFDHDALVQALINLVTNAVQYTDADDPDKRLILLSVYHQRGSAVLSVKDRGQGIPADERGAVFDKFHRGGDYLTRTVRGTGLGLSIVQHIAEAHGGEVRLDSEPGQGSTFYVLLPAEPQTY